MSKEVQVRELAARRFPDAVFTRELGDPTRIAEIRADNHQGDVAHDDIEWLCSSLHKLRVFARWLHRWRTDADEVIQRQNAALDMLRGWEVETVDGLAIYANLIRRNPDGTTDELVGVVPTDVVRTIDTLFVTVLQHADGIPEERTQPSPDESPYTAPPIEPIDRF